MIEKAPVLPVLPHSESIYCPHCGEEFGIESHVEDERHTQRDADHVYYMEEIVKLLKEVSNNDFSKETSTDGWVRVNIPNIISALEKKGVK